MGLSSGSETPLRTPVRQREPYDIRASLLSSGIVRFESRRRRSRVRADCGSRLRDVRAPFDDMIDETPNESTTLAEELRRFAKSCRDPIEEERRTRMRLIPTLTGQYTESLNQFNAMLKKQRSAYTESKNFTPSTNRSRSQVNRSGLVSNSVNIRASHPGSLDSSSVQSQWQFGQMMSPRSSTNEFDIQNNHNGSLLSRASSYSRFSPSVAASSSTAGTSERKRKADELDHANEAESKPPTKSRTEDF